jgi:ketosteroid isomerase-like protein
MTSALSTHDQLTRLIDGYDTGSGTLRGKGLSERQLLALARENGITVYMPGEYHDRDCVVITDTVYAYAVAGDGKPDIIAGH